MGSGRSGAEYRRMNAADREAKQDYSRGISPRRGGRPPAAGLGFLLFLSAVLGGVLLIAADLSTLYAVHVLTVVKGSVSGHSQHSYSLALVGLAALPMALAAAGRHRPAMLALAVLGAVALLIAAIAGDFHDIRSSGLVGELYESASATPERGFYLETLGAVLLIAAGLGQLLLPRPVASARPRPAPHVDPRVPPAAAEPPPPRRRDPDAAARPARPRRPPPPVDPGAAPAPAPPRAPAPPPEPDAAARAARARAADADAGVRPAPPRTPPPPGEPEREPDPDPDTWFS
ncbi:MAG: hypothetical protein QOE28_3254 [Solirubrobacteraceae bacterium]|nr:hypothetical protein [Solirubrobacteraceae bacterium]